MGGEALQQCEEWIEAPTLIVERDTFANFFHNSEDFFNAFLALAILGWPLNGLQILLTDLYPKGGGLALCPGSSCSLDAVFLRGVFPLSYCTALAQRRRKEKELKNDNNK